MPGLLLTEMVIIINVVVVTPISIVYVIAITTVASISVTDRVNAHGFSSADKLKMKSEQLNFTFCCIIISCFITI